MPVALRATRIDALLRKKEGFRLVRIDDEKIILAITDPSDPGSAGERLRKLETRLRDATGEPLEIYCETIPDANKPRSPEQRRKVREWLKSRVAMNKQAGDEK